jgi:hypothetical protein
MFLALVLAAAPVPPEQAADWKAAVKNRAFAFDPNKTGAAVAVESAKAAGLTAEFVGDADGFGDGTFTFQKKDGAKLTIDGHRETAIVVRGDVLYVAKFGPISTGCAVAAYDLTTGKKAWEKRLDGLGPIAHTKYRNRVMMAVEKHPDANQFALVITGREQAGDYIEVLDLATGKQLAHRKYEPDK